MTADSLPLVPTRRASQVQALAVVIAVVSAATILAAWAFQWAGYVPCELCLKERIAYYGGVPLAVLVAILAMRRRTSLLPAGFAGLALIFLAGAGVAAYHAGVEWRWWAGPVSCTGVTDAPARVEDFLKQLQSVNVVRCDAPALVIAGLSLAAWDAIVCAVLAILALGGAVRSRG